MARIRIRHRIGNRGPGSHMSPFFPTPTGASCTVRVTPRAGHSSIVGVRDGHLIVKLAAAPVEGAANAALLVWLADAFHLPRRSVSIAAGERSRNKRVTFEGVTPEALSARLDALLGG
jgi:uncharacterized protein (TIGR00251 family)